MREIQDSDDEVDDLEADVPPLQQQSASVQQKVDNDFPRQHGTGSTESLRKALQTEHRAQFQTQPSQVEPQSSVSLPEYPSKRRKHSEVPNSLQSRKAQSPRKHGSATYGKRSKSRLSSPGPSESGLAATETSSRPPPEADWNLEGTMRENYAYHEPMAMFPEPSSTVANATQTQLHIMEGVRAPAMLGMSSEADVPRNLLPPEPSVPWSELMKLTPGDALYQSESSNQEEPVSESTIAIPPPEDAAAELLASQQSRRASSTLSKGSPLRHEVALGDSQPLDQTDRSIYGSSTVQLRKYLAVSTDTSQRRKDRQETSQEKHRLDATAEHDDDGSIGLPREQYKPRPSRSRSLKADTQDAIDYSVTLERAKKTSKQRKTTNTSSGVEIPTTPQKIQQICDMGFTPTTTREALQQNSGDVASTVDWLVTNRVGEDELASFSTPRRKPFTPKAQAPVMDSEGLQVIMRNLNEYRKDGPIIAQSEAAAPTTANDTLQPESNITDSAIEHLDTAAIKSPRVQVVIPKKSPTKASSIIQESSEPSEPSKKKSKRRKTTLDYPESGQPIETLGHLDPVLGKKRGRGRPKKVVESANLMQEAPMHDAIGEEDKQQEALKVVEANVVAERVPAADLVMKGAVFEGAVAASAAPKTDRELAKAQTTEALLKPATPASKGNVPYRVGLSKRARIAPLLRVLKK